MAGPHPVSYEGSYIAALLIDTLEKVTREEWGEVRGGRAWMNPDSIFATAYKRDHRGRPMRCKGEWSTEAVFEDEQYGLVIEGWRSKLRAMARDRAPRKGRLKWRPPQARR